MGKAKIICCPVLRGNSNFLNCQKQRSQKNIFLFIVFSCICLHSAIWNLLDAFSFHPESIFLLSESQTNANLIPVIQIKLFYSGAFFGPQLDITVFKELGLGFLDPNSVPRSPTVAGGVISLILLLSAIFVWGNSLGRRRRSPSSLGAPFQAHLNSPFFLKRHFLCFSVLWVQLTNLSEWKAGWLIWLMTKNN